MFQVYTIVNLVNGKMYIGCTTSTLRTRWRKHKNFAAKGNKYSIQKAIRKYGEENFSIRMIETYSSKDEMLRGEINWIDYFNTYNSQYGYNESSGGECFMLGKKHSDEAKLKMSLASRGKPKSEAHRQALSEANMGNTLSEDTKKKLSKIMKDKGHRVGVKASESSKKKMSEAHQGKTHSTETKQKMSKTKKGKIFTKEHKQNLSKALKGKSHLNKGKPWSQARRDAQKRKQNESIA